MFQEIQKLQDKAIPVINFLRKGASMKEVYIKLEIPKIREFMSLQNALLVKDVFEEIITFNILYTKHLHTVNQSAFVPIVNTEKRGISSIKYRSMEIRNKLKKALSDDPLNLTQPKAEERITTIFLKSYLSP